MQSRAASFERGPLFAEVGFTCIGPGPRRSCSGDGVARGLGVSFTTVSRWENGTRTSVRVEVPPNMIELDGPRSDLLPHSKTIVSQDWRAIGGLPLRPIAVPHIERFQERRASGIGVLDLRVSCNRSVSSQSSPRLPKGKRDEVC